MIILNGGITVDGTEIYFEDLMIESDSYIDLPFDFLIDDEEDYDCDCDDYDCDCDEDDLDENVDALLEIYADILRESCGCPECTKEILLDFVHDFIGVLVE